MGPNAVRGDRVQQQGVAVGFGLGDASGCDGTSGAALIVDDDWLPNCVRELRADGPCDEIGGAAGRDRHDELNGPVGIVLLGAATTMVAATSNTLRTNRMRPFSFAGHGMLGVRKNPGQRHNLR
jgi:hypothetical protein